MATNDSETTHESPTPESKQPTKKKKKIVPEVAMLVMGAIAGVGLMIGANGYNDKIESVDAQIQTTQTAINQTKKQIGAFQEVDEVALMEGYEERRVNAEAIAKEVIEVDNFITRYAKAATLPVPEDDKEAREAFFKELETYKERDYEVRGTTEQTYIETWSLNPEWTLSLKSVAEYSSADSIPMMFEMTTKSGELAGLITANYIPQRERIEDVERYYTSVGRNNMANIGGR